MLGLRDRARPSDGTLAALPPYMLFTGGRFDLGETSYASLFAMERTFRLFAVERSGTVWDSRFVRAREGIAPDRSVLSFMLDGWLRVRGPAPRSIEAPAAIVTTKAALEGIAGDSGFSLVSGGTPLRTLQLTVAAADLLVPTPALVAPLPISAALVEAARSVVAAYDTDPGPPIAAFFDRCAAEGILRPGLGRTIVPREPQRIQRVWNGLSASTTFGALGSHQDIGVNAGFSTRQVSRVFEEIRGCFGLDWQGWRVLTNDLRLRLAVLLLSADTLTIADVARAAGYGSTNALALAFRRAGLPAPSSVRLEIRRDEDPCLPLTAAPSR